MNTTALKSLSEAALAFCREQQSPQTQFFHYFPGASSKGPHHTIPIVENFLFALALLKTKQSEQIIEAKELLKKLLHFYVKENGVVKGFPTYLHEYPDCSNTLLGLRLLPSCYWILRQFSSVIGPEIAPALREMVIELAAQCFQEYSKVDPSYALCLRMGVLLQAIGTLCDQDALAATGNELLNHLSAYDSFQAWNSPRILSDILIALQMADDAIQQKIGTPLWKHLDPLWHRATLSFIGPAVREYTKGCAPEITPFHLYMMAAGDAMPQEALVPSFVHLETLLFQDFLDRLSPEVIGRSGGISRIGPWLAINKTDYGYAAIQVDCQETLLKSDGFLPFRMVWQSGHQTQHFACQGMQCSVHYQEVDGGIDLFFDYDQPAEVDHRQKSRELVFYLNVDDKSTILVEGSRATTFELGDRVTIASPTFAFSLSFEIEEGEGSLVGHLNPGNRPSQLISQDTNFFTPYDWQLFLRTIRRTPKCRIKANIRPL